MDSRETMTFPDELFELAILLFAFLFCIHIR
jgi:hypothetical protein